MPSTVLLLLLSLSGWAFTQRRRCDQCKKQQCLLLLQFPFLSFLRNNLDHLLKTEQLTDCIFGLKSRCIFFKKKIILMGDFYIFLDSFFFCLTWYIFLDSWLYALIVFNFDPLNLCSVPDKSSFHQSGSETG